VLYDRRMLGENDKTRISAIHYDLIKQIEQLRVDLTRSQLSYNVLQTIIETAMESSEKDSDVIEELRNAGDDLSILAANELKALRDSLVITRLDRDSWRTEYQNERTLADGLYDIIFNDIDPEEKIKKIREVIHTYEKRRRG
jgi:hypothetical protein